ncbi:MAG: pantetheine-phosphate adenylyltransferase [Lachnospiraceae bacterium]|nr:pantetheine-phosphate adenylyltransferase [Lachnospiraceae bacterium]
MKAMYPGCFDPITNGHLDIIKRGAKLFDEVVVLVIDNRSKSITYTLEDRVKMVEIATKDIPGVKIDTYNGLTTDYIKSNDVDVIIRGVRNLVDYEYESSLLEIYKTQGVNVESVLLCTRSEFAYLSSTVVRQHAQLGGDLSKFVPKEIEPIIKDVYNV